MISEHSDDEEVLISCPMCNKPICPSDISPVAVVAEREAAVDLQEIQPQLIEPPQEAVGEEAKNDE